ncbi:MAG: XkdX family protein [Oscillospiraceae bacterium]|jgi:hypothetical protein|nr:XkdX family protein [Oscillospiraceae bacterium]
MEFWAMAWKFGWADKPMMREAVQVNCITMDQYKTITGEEYTGTVA